VVVVVVVVEGSCPGSQSQHSSLVQSDEAHAICAKFGFGVRPSSLGQSGLAQEAVQVSALDVKVVPAKGAPLQVSHCSYRRQKGLPSALW